ncbi:HtaA domain-containing protein [Streptomyces kebangsaanensis]|uniref:HtaA domain-containing protein n=1 Tax=Streptomyces kebangsaanensis TaxID=864058 RepID=UPI00093BBFCD|nr:HtaA domain-containing protein [Streptomyces kebangsaanensis]
MPATATATTTRRRPLVFAAAVATATALGATVLATAPSASAASVPLTGYELSWGIKESYRTYVTGPWTKGTFTVTDGASQADGNGVFTFTDGRGTYDSTKHTLRLSFKGTLTAESSVHGFKRTFSDFQYDSATGVLTADLTADDGEIRQDVPLATVEAPTGQDMSDLATTLTTEAGAFLGSASYAGAAGDPLSVVKKETTTSPSPSAEEPEPSAPEPTSLPTSPTASASPSAPETGSTIPAPSTSAFPSAKPTASAAPSTSTAPAPAKGDIADGRLTWGVKESFRGYVVGPVAKGKVTTSDGASQADGNGVFTFTDATGTHDTEAGTLSAAFKGSVNFKGHQGEGDGGGYGLDLTLGNVRAAFDGGSGKLTADVTSLGERPRNVVLADLKAGSTELTATNDVITLNDVKATLTEAGAKAFGGFYDKGAALDPVNLSVALAEDAELPSGNGTSDGGSGTGGSGGAGSTTGGTGGTGGIGSTTGGIGGSMASTGSDVPVGALGAAAAATVAAGAGVLFAMRRRRDTQA